jgi:hypothetical protein
MRVPLYCLIASLPITAASAQDFQFRPPLLAQEGQDKYKPAAYAYVEPKALDLPSAEQLKTIEVKGRTYNITKVAGGSAIKEADKAEVAANGRALYENADEALYFHGSGGGGRRSNERLIIEDCTFIVDFQEGDFGKWDERRVAIFVTGYREVLVRNCVFIVKGLPGEPDRRTMGSIAIYDTVKVQVEDCYFEGLTNWMRGHLIVYGCGPTSIRRVEVTGSRRDGRWLSGGGIWVATGLGEGKVGTPHYGDDELMIYPAGPLLVEDTLVHRQQGDENTDGIYIQSIHPYLVRNTRVADWGKDGLMDLGFRDSGGRSYQDKPLANHGAIGVVENCEFQNGYVKDSVGMAGGLIFRNNVCRNVWLYPYVFDGGSWWVLNNQFTDLTGVALSGRDGQTTGWSAKEGMLANGSKLYFIGNEFANQPGVALPALLVSSTVKTSTLKDNVTTDYNQYAFDTAPKVWADDQAAGVKYQTLADWREATGHDANSVTSAGSRPTPGALELPGGLKMDWSVKPGLTGEVGVANKAVLARAKELSNRIQSDYERRNKRVEAESLPARDASAKAQIEERTWASGGKLHTFEADKVGDSVTFTLDLDEGGRYWIQTAAAKDGRAGIYQLSVNGRPVGKPVDLSTAGVADHDHVELKAGANTLTYTVTGKSDKSRGYRAVFDLILLKDSEVVAQRQEAAAKLKAEEAARKAEVARLDALSIKIEAESLEPTNVKGKGSWVYGNKQASDGNYRLWESSAAGDALTLPLAVEKAGVYRLVTRYVQQGDKANVQALVDGKAVGDPAPLGGRMQHGEVELSGGSHKLTLQIDAAGKVRLDRIDLIPVETAAQAE